MAKGPRYAVKFRRRRENKTNYKQRISFIKSGKLRLVVRRSNKYITAQIVQYSIKGDKTLAFVNSKELEKLGWKYSKKNIPAAYLTGLLCGKRAIENGVKEAILDTGLSFGESTFAAAKGFVDSGVNLPLGKEVSERRIQGFHIEDYAKELKEKDPKRYEIQFSKYLKKGFDPTKFVEHFNEVKSKIGGN